MHGICFKKDYAQKVLDAIKNNQPIPAPHEGWSGQGMMTAAGTIFAAIYSQGPHTAHALGLTPEKVAKLHPEKKEAIDETLARDIHDGIQFASQLAFAVMDGEYDARFEQEVKAVVYEDAEGKKKVIGAAGFKTA